MSAVTTTETKGNLLERTIDGVTDLFIVVDHDWRYLFLNRAARDWFTTGLGMDTKNVLGKVLWDVAPHLIGTRFETEYRAAAKDLRPRSFESFMESRGIWYDVRVYPTTEFITLQIRDVTRTRQRQEFLAEASRVLSETLDYRATLRRLARLAVPRMADWCTIDVANEQGALERREVAHTDPAKVILARNLHERFPPDRSDPRGTYGVFHSGKSEHVREITDAMLEQSIENPEFLEAIRALGLRSVMIVPLIAHGITLGVMTFVSAESGRLYDESDVSFAEDLASRAAVAAENGRLYEEARRREREEAALRKAAESVTAIFSVEEIIEQIAHSALEATEADGSFVERVVEGGAEVRVVAVAGEMHPEIGLVLPFEGSMAQVVLEQRQPRIIKVLSETAQFLPGVLTEMYADSSALAVPLMDGGEAIGTLILVRSPQRAPFTDAEAQRAHTFGNLAALAFRKVNLLDDSERKREELEELIVSRARLMRGFTHDLKNPLGAADGHAALLADGVLGALSPQQANSVERIRAALKNAVDLINDLVELERAESGQLQIRRQPLDVREVCREMVEQYRPAAEQAGLSIAGALEKVDLVPSDVDRVRQILGNLLSNAVKYTPAGGSIEVRTRMSRSGNMFGGRECAVIDVADTGIGIPEDKVDVLFREFERIDPTVRPGVGLGLAISRRIARLLGGEVTVTTTRGAGSVFTLWLPAGAV